MGHLMDSEELIATVGSVLEYVSAGTVTPISDQLDERYITDFQWFVCQMATNGTLVVGLSHTLAVDVAMRMFKQPPSELDDTDIVDAVGELTNMMAGKIQDVLAPGAGLGVPHEMSSDEAQRLAGRPFQTQVLIQLGDGYMFMRLLHGVVNE